jgi:hypothetical protein
MTMPQGCLNGLSDNYSLSNCYHVTTITKVLYLNAFLYDSAGMVVIQEERFTIF